MSEWIKCSERLPGEQGFDSPQVLLFLMGHCDLLDDECRQGRAWGIRLGYYDVDIGCFRVHGRPEEAVTHWQELPEPPTRPTE